MGINVNKLLFLTIIFIIPFSVFSQKSENFKQIWYNEKINGIIIESSNSFKLFYLEDNQILLDKISKNYVVLKNKDIFSFNFLEMIKNWQLIDSNLVINYHKNLCGKLTFRNENFKENLIFKKKKRLFIYDSIVIREYLVNYELTQEIILNKDTLKPGFHDKILIEKDCYIENESIYFDIYSYLIYNENSNLPVYPHAFDDGTYCEIELYIKNEKVKRKFIEKLPNYIDGVIWTDEKLMKFRKLFKGTIL
ncbi:MAG: hypothetical protein R2771_05435 [Saprospiraceae bacterium]